MDLITTERLRLARPTLADFTDSFAMSGEAAVVRHLGGKPASREDAWNKLLRNIGHWTAFGYGVFTVRGRADHAFLGEVGIAHFSRGLGAAFDPFPEAAWGLVTRVHGKGYATEAVIAAHDWMFREHRARRTVCIVHPDNRASLRLAQKVGYRPFGKAQYRDAAAIMFERTALE